MKRAQTSVVSGIARSGWQGALASITAVFLIVTVSLSACTSTRPVADDAEALQQRIRDGKVLQRGDHIRVVTHDGMSQRLTVLSVEDDVLKGQLDNSKARAPSSTGASQAETTDRHQGNLAEIPVRDIVFIEEEQVSVGKTAGAIGGGTIVVLSALLLIALLSF